MNREQFTTVHGSLCDSLKKITAVKNADYTGASDSSFFNFETVEMLKVCTTEQGFLTRMMDKFCRIASLLKTGKQNVKDESIEDTLLDLANYCIILVCYLRHKRASAPVLHSVGVVKGSWYNPETCSWVHPIDKQDVSS